MNEEVTPAMPDHELEKRQTLWILLALFFVAGWFGTIVGEESSYYPLYRLIFGLGSTIFIVRWVALDASALNFRLTRLWIFFFVIFSLLAVPAYLLKTRGKESWRPILASLGWLFLFGIAMAIGGAIAVALGL